MTRSSDSSGPRSPRETITVSLPADLLERLKDFRREYGVSEDVVVERALLDYFREGDMSH